MATHRHLWSFHRRMLCLSLGAMTLAPAFAFACGGTSPVAQIESGGSLYFFPGSGQINITATIGTPTTANSWRIAWYGGDGVTHFTGRMIDSGGGSMSAEDSTSGTITQPTADEIDFAATWDSNTELSYEYLDFISTSPTVAFYPTADNGYYIVSYPIPGNVEGHPQAYAFGLSFNATPKAIPDFFDNVYCNGFDGL